MPPSLKSMYQIGTSFRSASACERKHLSLGSDAARELSEAISSRIPGAEFCLLSTCNRTEFYLFSPTVQNPIQDLLQLISDRCPHFNDPKLQIQLRSRHGSQAFRHLLRVACGLESLILGDTQIVQQIRQSLRIAREAGASGPYLEQAFGAALRLGSRVRHETNISAGSAGVAAAVCDTIETWQASQGRAKASVLLVGAGSINTAVGRMLVSRTANEFTVINRGDRRGRQLAAKFGVAYRAWSDLPAALAEANVVVAATAAASPVINSDLLTTLDAKLPRGDRKLVVDAGMPPNVEDSALSRIDVVGIDHLKERQTRHLERRRTSVPQIEQQISEELEAWDGWLAQQPLEHVLKSLYLDLAEMPQRLASHISGSGITPSPRLDYQIRREVKKLLHPHVHDLRRLIRNRRIRS